MPEFCFDPDAAGKSEELIFIYAGVAIPENGVAGG